MKEEQATYDDSCYDLAESFLSDLGPGTKYGDMSVADQDKCKHQLATLIQECIEDYLSTVDQ